MQKSRNELINRLFEIAEKTHNLEFLIEKVRPVIQKQDQNLLKLYQKNSTAPQRRKFADALLSL